jgi:hypothetical protein
MSYWSLRRAAERAAAGHDLAHGTDNAVARARSATHDAYAVELHPATVSSPGRTLRQRAADLERALWTIPTEEAVVELDSGKVRARSRW